MSGQVTSGLFSQPHVVIWTMFDFIKCQSDSIFIIHLLDEHVDFLT